MTKPPDPNALAAHDPEAIMHGIHRKVMTLLGNPRRCRERLCRRTKRCAGPTMRCERDFPAPDLTPEETAQLQFDLKRALARRLAQLQS